MDLAKFNARVSCELNNAKRNPANARLFGARCMAMFELMAYMTGDDSLLDTWETAFRPLFDAYEKAYLKGVFPDENN